MSDPDAIRRVTLRGLGLVSGGLALALAVLGFAPGHEVYRGHRLVEVASVAGSPAGLAAVMAIAAALAAYDWRRPQLATALFGSLASIGVSVFALALTAPPRLPPGERAVELPAAALASQLVLALVLVQLVVRPIACALLVRAGRRVRIARARVHRIGAGGHSRSIHSAVAFTIDASNRPAP